MQQHADTTLTHRGEFQKPQVENRYLFHPDTNNNFLSMISALLFTTFSQSTVYLR